MTPAAIQAIKDRASTFTDCPLYWPNEVIPVLDAPAPYVWAEITGLTTEIRSMGVPGNHWLRDHGLLRAHVAIPSGQGTDAAYSIGENLAALFRIASFGGIQTLAPTPADAGAYDGDWFVSSFSIPFWFDYTG